MDLLARWRTAARRLTRETYTLSCACRDPRVPWYAKVLAAAIVAYAFSPIDLIPDFIPVLGYLDDVVLLPLGVLLVRRMIPDAVMTDCRRRADAARRQGRPVSRVGAAIVIALWVALAVGGIIVARRLLSAAP